MGAYVGKKKRATPKMGKREPEEKGKAKKAKRPSKRLKPLARKPNRRRPGPAAVKGRKRSGGRTEAPRQAGRKERPKPRKKRGAPRKSARTPRPLTERKIKRPAARPRKPAPAARPKKRAVPKPKKRAAPRPKPKKRAVPSPKPKKRAVRKPTRPTTRRPPKKTAAQAGARRKQLALARTLAKELDRERSKLRAKKLRLSRKKLKKQQAKVDKLRAKLEKVVALPPPLRGVRHEDEQAARLARYESVFDELLRLAREKKQLHQTDVRKRRFDTEDRAGDQRTRRTNIVLDEPGVEESMHVIGEVIRELPGHRHFWICNFELVGMGERLIGYGNRILQVNHPDAHNFQIAIESSGVSTSTGRMLALSREALEQYADEVHTLVRVLSVRVVNFSFKER